MSMMGGTHSKPQGVEVGGCLPVATRVVVILMSIGMAGIVLGMTDMGDAGVVWAMVRTFPWALGQGS